MSKTIEEQKHEINLRAKAELHSVLQAKSWEEKVAAIEQMNEAGTKAREAMRRAKEAERRNRDSR